MSGDRAGGRSTMALADVRRHHLSVVLERLLRAGPRSRATLAQETGLTKATVSALAADLLGRGLVEEREPRPGRMGRPAVELAVTDASVAALGLRIEADHVAACLVGLPGPVLARHRLDGDFRRSGPGVVLRRVREVATAALADADAI